MEDYLYYFKNKYQKLPNEIKNLIGVIYRNVPNRLRYGHFFSVYLERIKEFNKNPNDLSFIKSKQIDLLLKSVNYAIYNIPF